LLDLVGRHGRAGVRDGQEGVPVAGRGSDLEISAGDVVLDRVVNQVGDQTLEQSWIARGSQQRAETARRVEPIRTPQGHPKETKCETASNPSG
jgi:hypothetical protein